MICKIFISNLKQTLRVSSGTKLMKALTANKINIAIPCGSAGICGKCKVEFLSPPHPMNYVERKFCKGNERLACQTIVKSDIEIRVTTLSKIAQIVRSDKQIDFPIDNQWGRWGFAVDIGTTTIVMYLVDLALGLKIDAVSELNKQAVHGSDVVTRINYCLVNRNTVMHDIIVAQLNQMAATLKARNTVPKVDVMLIVGNTTMQHFVCNYPVDSIAKMPYVAHSLDAVDCMGANLGITEADRVYVAPSVSAFIGADIIAGLIVCDMSSPSMLLDLGTNGEFVIGCGDKFMCCSTAAGPAFEGNGLECGVGAILGAVSSVKLRNDGLDFATIGDEPAIGICGSGILDAVSEMVRVGIVDETGAMEVDRLQISSKVYVSRADVRKIQLAKAAIAAGIQILMSKMEFKRQQIANCYIAGGFGSYANKHSLASLGILPVSLLPVTKSIGNSAGDGAIAMLLSNSYRKRAVEICSTIEHIELNSQSESQDLFVENMFYVEN